ncbi:MAG: SLBB domain-containing protein [candidate division WOR-3 bacterium]
MNLGQKDSFKFIVRGSGFITLLSLFALASAQPATSGTTPLYQTPMFKYYVWGQVRSPGAYSLSANPDVVELISAGGGPTTEADLSRVVLVRAISKSRVRINLKKMLAKGEVIPLSPGDVVIVPRSFWYSFRNELTFVSTVAVLVNLTLTIINLTQK